MLVGLVDVEVDGSEISVCLRGGALGLVRLVVDGNGGDNGVVGAAFGDVHPNAVDGEGQVGLLLVVHRNDGERELSQIVAYILCCVVDNRFRCGSGFDRFLAGRKDDGDATQCDDECFLHVVDSFDIILFLTGDNACKNKTKNNRLDDFSVKNAIFAFQNRLYEKEMDSLFSADRLGFGRDAALCFWPSGRPDAFVDVDIAAFGGHRDGLINKGGDFVAVCGRVHGGFHHGLVWRPKSRKCSGRRTAARGRYVCRWFSV